MNWNYAIAARPQARAALSPSEKRDSILRAVRAPAVFDSLTKANYDTAAISLAKRLVNPPNFGGGFGGRGGGGGGGGRGAGGECFRPLTQWEQWCSRPAEAAPGTGRGAAAAQEGAQEQAQALQNAGTNPAVVKIFGLIGLPVPAQGGRGGGGGFGGLGGGGNANTGDYGVILQVGNTTQKAKLRVENTGAAGGASPFGFFDEEGLKQKQK